MLSNQQIEQYHEDGFLIVRDFFVREELQMVMDWIDELVDNLANHLYDVGKIQDKHENEGFYTRLTALERDYPGAAVLIHIGGILGQPLADLWANPRLLDLVEQILGPEIAGHPVWNLRSKTPLNSLVTVPWHQDTAYLAEGAQNTLQPTAWIPLLDAKAENGTLQVLRGGHKTQNVYRHHLESSRGHKASWYLYIDEADLPPGEVVTCEMEFGSFLLLNQLIPHRSTENLSDNIRWSVDLRWQRPDEVSGFEGVKDPILMRSAQQPGYQLDWREWALQNRIAAAMEAKKDEFDASVMGPWLHRWAQNDARIQDTH